MLSTHRILRACLLAAVLLAGAFEPHPAGESHLQAWRKGVYSRSARHPGAAAHFEAIEEESCPACPVCLHQRRTGAARIPVASPLAALALTGLHEPASLSPAVQHFATPRGARGPPVV